MQLPNRFAAPQRWLMGPGPSDVPARVLEAMAAPVVGHLDPAFIRLMEEIKTMLRAVFRTRNEMTFPVSGTGSAGMEFCFVNLLEPGDEAVIGVNGVFGSRMVDVAERCGARVIRVEAPWGQIITPEGLARALKDRHPKIVAVVHAETSTGAWTPVQELVRLSHDAGALFVLDTVTSLGGCPVLIDEWQVDAVYSGSQKCLSCPPGLSPVSFNARALETAARRKKKVQSWYLDVNLLAAYWGQDRAYHHTAPISMNYGLHEALRAVLEEGLEARWERHRQNHLALKGGIGVLGLTLHPQAGFQLWPLNAIQTPPGIDEALIRKKLLDEFSIEIGAGLGPLKGKIWRVGLMGESSRRENVRRFLSSFGSLLEQHGWKCDVQQAIEAAGSAIGATSL